MTRTPVKVNTEAPPQWRGREGWIVERKPGDYYLVDLKGGGQGVFHDKELDRPTDAQAEPATATVMVGHCPVTVPASVAAERAKLSPCVMSQWDAAMADAGFPAPRMVADWKWPAPATVTALHATQAADWLTITKQVQDLPPLSARASLGFSTTDTEGGAKD